MRRSRRYSITSLKEVIELAERHDVISFDLFDTLIARRGLRLEEIQHLSAEKLLLHLDPVLFDRPEDVLLHRQKTTDLLRDSVSVGSREPLLETVFERILASGGGISEHAERVAIAADAAEFERQLEQNSLVAHPDAVEVISQLKRAGKKVIAISDMYFSPAQMDRLLERKGLRQLFDEVFVSTGIGQTKREGHAFETVRARLDVAATRILHVGDNAISDVRNAVAAGWSAAHIARAFAPPPQTPPTSGAAQLIDLASDIIASFLMTVLLHARRHGIRRVFFLSRDATTILRVWDVVRTQNPELATQFDGIEIRELCVSRSSTHVLSMAWSKGFLLEAAGRVAWLTGRSVSYREVVEYYGLPLPATAGRADRQLSAQRLAAAMDRDGIEQSLRDAIRARQEMVLAYLRQEGAVGSGHVAFADIGYSGTVAVYLANHLLREAPELMARTRIDVLLAASNSYLEQNRVLSELMANVRPGLLFRHEQLPAILSDNFAWLECLFRDTARGQLRGYRQIGARVEPVFDDVAGSTDTLRREFERAALVKLSGGIDALAFGTAPRIESIRDRAIAAFGRPSMALVEAATELWQEADALGLASHPVVERAPASAVATRLRHWKVHDYWISGCLVASGLPSLIDRYDALKSGHSLLRKAASTPGRGIDLTRRMTRRMLRR
ncbi:MAG: HAD family hydrolase [Rhizobiaceae bacterium]